MDKISTKVLVNCIEGPILLQNYNYLYNIYFYMSSSFTIWVQIQDSNGFILESNGISLDDDMCLISLVGFQTE